LESPKPDRESGAEASNLAEKLWDIEQIKRQMANQLEAQRAPENRSNT
jgi:hypothetical protein